VCLCVCVFVCVCVCVCVFVCLCTCVCVCVREREREMSARVRAKETASAPDKHGTVQERSKTKDTKVALRKTCQRGRNVASDESGSVCFKYTKQTCGGKVMISSSTQSVI